MESKTMNTDELIALLAHDAGPARGPKPQQVGGRLAVALAVCGVMVLYLGLNPKLSEFASTSVFSLKMVWLFAMVVFSATLVYRMVHPGRQMGNAPWAIGLALLAMGGQGMSQLLQAPVAQRSALALGTSWQVCTLNIAFIALPVLAALMWTLRDMAPTRPALTGAMAGLCAGALAAMLYSLHCTENSFTFYALWYSGGMGLSAVLGAVLGNRFLRW
jgi:hypothetical protein